MRQAPLILKIIFGIDRVLFNIPLLLRKFQGTVKNPHAERIWQHATT